MSCDECRHVRNPLWFTACWTGWGWPCDALLTRGPTLCCIKESTWWYVHACFHCTFCLFHLQLYVLARLPGKRSNGTRSSLKVSSFSEGFGSGMRLSSQGDNQAKQKIPFPHQLRTKKERTVQNLLLSLPSFWLNLSLSVFFCSLWLVFNCSRGNHNLAGLQGIIAPPPGLPEDALLPLMSLLGRRALEVSAVQVRATTVTEPPAT